MNIFFKRLSLANLIKNLKEAFSSFPLSFLISFIIFFIFVFLVYKNFSVNNVLQDILTKSIFSLSLVYFLSIWVYLLAKVFDFSKLKTCLSQIFSILFWIWFYFSLPDFFWYDFFTEDFVYITITFVWIFAFLFISKFIKSYLKKQLDNDRYYNFFNEIIGKITKTLVVWFVSMILWAIALASIFTLFDLYSLVNEDKFYWYWAAFSFSLFAPIFFLIQATSINNDKNTELIDEIRENKFYSFLNNYLALPFIIFYFFILYVYSIKVLINFTSWPEWIVSWMVIWFSLFWYLVFIFSYAFEEKMAIVRIFRKYFPYAVLLQAPMLFYAIYLRINQYDFTINRYLVVVLWIYLVTISLYFIFSKKKYLLFIPNIFALFILIISIWPWGVYSFPETRQLSKLENNLKETRILNWDIINLPKSKIDIDKEKSIEMYGQIEYLCSYYWCESMKFLSANIEKIKQNHKIEWEKNHKEELERAKLEDNLYKIDKSYIDRLEKENYPWIYYWELKTKLTEELKLQNYYEYQSETESSTAIFSLENPEIPKTIDIKWYDYFVNLSNSPVIKEDILSGSQDKQTDVLYNAAVDFKNKKIFVYKANKILEEISMEKQINEFYEINKNNLRQYSQIKIDKPFEINISWNKVDLKLYATYFEIKNPNYKIGNANPDHKWENINTNEIQKMTLDSYYGNWYLLIKEK